MKAALQRKIAPPVVRDTQALNDAKVAENPVSIQSGAGSEVDFKSLLMNSNRNVRKEREARSTGDLSGASSYEDFLQELNRRTQKGDAPKNSLDKNDFLKLFVTQLQHQDPLKPKDGAEMASQLAQFNGLEQMMNVNTTLEKLANGQVTNRSVQLMGLVGKEVAIDGGSVSLKGGKASALEMDVAVPLGGSTIEVRDGTGELIRSEKLGPQKIGKKSVLWDGKDKDGKVMPDGVYNVSVVGSNSTGDPVDIPTTARVKVEGINLADQSGQIFTDTGPIKFDQIKAFGEVGFKSRTAKPGVEQAPASSGPQVGNPTGSKPVIAPNGQVIQQDNTPPPFAKQRCADDSVCR